jgi:hypothetical protein
MINNNDKTVSSRYKNLSASLILIISLSFSSLAGKERKGDVPPFKDRLFYGGSFALQLGTITNIEVSPVIGLWVLPRLAIAAGPSFRYYKFGNDKTNIFGGKTYFQVVVLQDLDRYIPIGVHSNFFLHFEDEVLSLKSDFWDPTSLTSERFLINTTFAGVGLSQAIGRRSSFNFIVMWALNKSDYDIYGNPEIKIGFIF